jgi:hypothetical protein
MANKKIGTQTQNLLHQIKPKTVYRSGKKKHDFAFFPISDSQLYALQIAVSITTKINY